MNPLSGEQELILNHIKDGKNVVVDAVAGSGKSTTVLSVAKELQGKQVLQLTYNSSLRTEIKEKTRTLQIKNLQIHTYHSLGVRYYLPTCFTDAGLRHILYQDLTPSSPLPLYDLIVIDETQDMSLIYYQLVRKFIKDMCQASSSHAIQLLILGDEKQGLYEFKGSDVRFLTKADQVWANNPHLRTPDFVKCTMKMSYRITDPMCSFVNQVLLGENRLESCRDGQQVLYIRNSQTGIENTVIFHINKLLNSGEATPNDIFVLGGSVKGTMSNIRKMENALVNQGIPCHVPMLEQDKIDERVIQGKVVFSTFHTVKGRQRKYVFIVGFDNRYMEFCARNLPKDRCPNTLYVACTRATHGLFLLETDQRPDDRPLEFLQMNHHEMRVSKFIDFKGQARTLFYGKQKEAGNVLEKQTNVTPTELIKFIPESVLEEITPLLDRIFVKLTADTETIEIPTIIETTPGLFEEVSDVTGIAIQSIFYDSLAEGFESNVLVDMIEEGTFHLKKIPPFLKEILENLPEKMGGIEDYLYLANIYIACQENLYFKLKQIPRENYGWLSDEKVEECKARMNMIIGKECEQEVPRIEETIIHGSDEESHVQLDAVLNEWFPLKRFRFSARTDIITADTVWELKCTSQTSIDHLLQVVIYAWIWRRIHHENVDEVLKDFKIMNVRTGEIMILYATMEELDTIMYALLRGKYSEQVPKSDEEFIFETVTEKTCDRENFVTV